MELAIGVEIFVSNNGLKSIEKIVRETNTMWITEKDSTKIYKKDNSIVGSSSSAWNNKHFVIATQEHYDLLNHRKLANKMKSFNFDKLSLEQLEKINLILENK